MKGNKIGVHMAADGAYKDHATHGKTKSDSK